MKDKTFSQRPTNARTDFPLALALQVRNFIVQTMAQVPLEDRKTFDKFFKVIFELERSFDMFD
jgi:hypothetical protein